MKKISKTFMKISDIINKFADDIFLIIGIILLSKGFFIIYIPAGYITLGICLITFAYLIAKKGG
jgi:hypothetical protein